MASSLQTLIKILQLEEKKGFQNKAVIGGFARFAYHWSREAHGQARTDEHHQLVDEVAQLLRDYENLSVDERPAAVEQIIQLAKGQGSPSAPEVSQVETPAPAAKSVERKPPPEQASGSKQKQTDDSYGGDAFDFLFEDEDEDDLTPIYQEEPARSVRERRGYAHRQKFAAAAQELKGLQASASMIKGVGDKRLEQLEKLGIQTIHDMLLFFPRRYDDYSRMAFIKDLKLGEEATVIGILERVKAVSMKSGGKRVEAYLGDDTGYLRLNWFNQPWMEHQLNDGDPVVVSGKVEQYLGRMVMNTPELEHLERDWLHTGRVVPVYSLTEGLTSRVMRNIMKTVVDEWAGRLPEFLPLDVLESADLMDYDDAIGQAHFPDSWEDKEAALHRLAFDQLFLLQMAMLQWRYQWQKHTGTPIQVTDEWLTAFEEALPYQLTNAQQQVVVDIRSDMANDVPMNRLLQGDVGSGKTVVAAIAMAMAVTNNTQAVLMAPTSILAEQHFATLDHLIRQALGEDINVRLLTGDTSAAEKTEIYEGLASGQIQVVIGTHALIQEGVEFAHLGLAVIDEQHRFGVEQRGALRHKSNGGNPHLLVMTATPIPRTLALTVHADLDLSLIDEMPPGREPVETRVMQPKERERVYSFIRGQIEAGHQAYIVYPLVEESVSLDFKAAVPEYEYLQANVFPDLRLGLLHGRMKPAEKDEVMALFYQGEIDILISTTVIEVGIDVPNATVMLIEDANRFGLAQLHQLRGRVGRGGHKGFCLLMSDKSFLDTDERLNAVANTSDGFKLAEIDWQIRGAGELLGTRQSGMGDLDLASLMDIHLVETVQKEVWKVFERDPELRQPEHQALAEKVSHLSSNAGDVS